MAAYCQLASISWYCACLVWKNMKHMKQTLHSFIFLHHGKLETCQTLWGRYGKIPLNQDLSVLTRGHQSTTVPCNDDTYSVTVQAIIWIILGHCIRYSALSQPVVNGLTTRHNSSRWQQTAHQQLLPGQTCGNNATRPQSVGSEQISKTPVTK